MANTIKYSTSGGTLAINEGSYWIGVGDVPKGPTPVTDYWSGISPPLSGYTIYLGRVTNGPIIYTTSTDAELISLTNTIGGQSFSTIGTALNWYNTQADKMVVNIDYPTIVTSGIVLNLDAGFVPSYPTINTTWYDLSGYASNGTLTNGPTYNTSGGGTIVLDGVDDYIQLGNIIQNSNSSTTIEVVMKSNSNIINPTTEQMNFILNGLTSGSVDGYDQLTLSVNTSIPLITLKSRVQYSSGLNKYSYQVYYQILSNDLNNYPVVVQKYYNPGGSLFSEQINYPQIINQIYSYVWSITNSDLGTRSIKHYLNGQQISGLGSAQSSDFNFFNQPNLRLGFKSNSNISVLRLYNKPLTQSEVLQNYQVMLPRFLGANIVTSGLVFYVDAGYSPSYPTSGLTWYDVSGYGNNGTLTNGPTYSSANGGSIVFDGVDDYVSLPINSTFNTPSVTYEVWANLQTISDRHILYVNWQGNSLEVSSNRSVVMFNFSSGGQLGATTAANVFNWDSWTHFLGTYDASSQTLKTYVNGVLLATRTSTPSTIYAVGTHQISGVQYGGEVKGNISIVRQYNRELTQAEITQNYNAQKSRYGL
jgi:hypothetical protein